MKSSNKSNIKNICTTVSQLRVNYKTGHNLHIQYMHDTHRSITVNILVAGTLLYQLVYSAPIHFLNNIYIYTCNIPLHLIDRE
jgi:hypothetical protein